MPNTPDWKPETQPVAVRMRVPGEPEKVFAQGEEQPSSLPETNIHVGEAVPQFDPAEHARVFGSHWVNNTLHYQQPQFMTARQILKTHRLVDETGVSNTRVRSALLLKKLREINFANSKSYTDDANLLAVNNASSFGAGSGHGTTEGLTNKGWDWDKPIPLGVHPESGDPAVLNGQHRLAYMWMHHPDVPMPIETTDSAESFVEGRTREHRAAIQKAYQIPSQTNLDALGDLEKSAAKEKRDLWFAKMASVNLPKPPAEK